MEEFLRSIGINGDFQKMSDGSVILDITDISEYERIYSILDKSSELALDDDSSQVTYETSSLQYQNDKYLITLLADMQSNSYKLTIKEIGGEK